MDVPVLVAIALGGLIALTLLLAVFFRVVVSTNEVHIVQSGKRTVSYGKDQEAGNVYYNWPAWIPRVGVQVIHLPVSVFDVDLNGYAAYDKGRVPFVIDIMAFFRITDSNIAAQRVSSFDELMKQLQGVLQGACRSILASSEIEEILEGRSKFGEIFTKEVDHNLAQWGVQSVKLIELMDIRDAEDSEVIHNIKAKKTSLIAMESRVEIAKNQRTASVAEVEAARQVEVAKQEAAQVVGIRTAEKDRETGIAGQQAQQAIKEQERETAEKHMAVFKVQEVRKAEIAREVQVVNADQQKKTAVISAEGAKQQTILVAEGNLEQAKLQAQGVKLNGEAKGAADFAVLLAPVNSQITLAKEIGGNEGYQKYLLGVKEIDKNQVVGVAQAEALKAANIKVIANSGDVPNGVTKVMDLLTPRGGAQLGGMVEALAQNPTVAGVLKALNGGSEAHQ